ncbi:kelch domain-containing protein 10-like [Photinus pyralis]|nr:kelch domain-containing protein 10-like [Photinus pyralis]
MNDTDSQYTFKLFNFELVESSEDCPVPEPRNAHRIVCNSKSLYLYGGYNPKAANDGYQELWEFNFCTKRWRMFDITGNFPEEVISCSVLRRKDKLVVYGGTGVPFAFKCSNKLYTIKLDEEVRISSLVVHGKKPKRQYGQSVVMHKNMLYTVGGTDCFSYNCDVHRVNLNKHSRVWKQLYSKTETAQQCNGVYHPIGRYRHELAFDGKNIYMIGGGTAISSFDLVDIPIFNTRTRKWKQIKAKPDPTNNYPANRRCHALAQMKTADDVHVFVLGGYENNEEAFNDLWRLELSTLQWTLLARNVLPKSPYFHSVALTREGKLYVFGGMEGGTTLRRNNKLFSAWVRIPTLAEIAWEAFLHYFPDIARTNKINRLQLPNRFLSRID